MGLKLRREVKTFHLFSKALQPPNVVHLDSLVD